MRNPVETRKLKFDGTAKPSWHGDLVEAVEDRWLVVFFERPAYAIRGEPVAYALQFYGMRQPLSVLVCFEEAGKVIEWSATRACRRGSRDGSSNSRTSTWT